MVFAVARLLRCDNRARPCLPYPEFNGASSTVFNLDVFTQRRGCLPKQIPGTILAGVGSYEHGALHIDAARSCNVA